MAKELAPTFEPEDDTTRSAESLQDLCDAGGLEVEAFSSLSVVFRFGGLITNLCEILRADLDGDGIEEILVSSYSRAANGTLGFGRSVTLGRKSNNGLLRVLDVDPGHISTAGF